MSILKVLFRIFSVLAFLGGLVGGGLMIASGTVATQGPQNLGAGFAILVSYGSGISILVSGLLVSMTFWWMGNVHDYLQNLSERR